MQTKILVTGESGFIGSELIQGALDKEFVTLNVDMKPPIRAQHRQNWVEVDVRSLQRLESVVQEFKPDYVVHLASDIDVNLKSLDEYRTITAGTKNIVDVSKSLNSLKRFVHVSTQYVVKPGIEPKSETDFEPYTLYGEAKALSERIVREANIADFIIVRPTIIWGPHHPSFAKAIWRHIALRTYMHPTMVQPIRRTYGFVRNTADQIMSLLEADCCSLKRQVFYLGDAVIDYDTWADTFSIALTGRPAKRISHHVLKALAIAGSAGKVLGVNVPLDMGRYFRMTTSAVLDLSPTLEIVGPPKVPFERGVRESVDWLITTEPNIFKQSI